MSNKDSNKLPPREYLIECFDYNEETGDLIWKERPLHHFKNEHIMKIFNIRYTGKKAGSISLDYIKVELTYQEVTKKYAIHRLIWKYFTDKEPIRFIDHIDNNKLNNRIENLREATDSQNCRNSKKNYNNTSGYKGVTFVKNRKVYRARIVVNYKIIHLGYFNTAEEAHEAYCEAAIKYHKDFYNFG